LIHQSWGYAGLAVIDMQRKEKQAFCALLGAPSWRLSWLDVICRHDPQTSASMIFNKTELFGKPLGDGLEKVITAVLREALPINAIVVLSLGLGRYCIDYRSVVRAGGRLAGEER